MLNRQKVVLSMLRDVGGRATPLQIAKWCFLIFQEAPQHGGDSFYEFLPYLHGPYSFGLRYDLGVLERDGLIKHEENSWVLTNAGQNYPISLAVKLHNDIAYVLTRYRHLSTSDLIDYVYERYTWFTVNAKDEGRRASAAPEASAHIYTAGYERLQVDGFLNMLLKNGIVRLIDVRSNPVARRYGFHKSSLSKLSQNVGIEYVHVPEVGIPTAWRTDLNTLRDYEILFDRYEAEILPKQAASLRRIAEWHQEKPSVLVCQEADPRYCHRARVANALTQINLLPITHIGWPR